MNAILVDVTKCTGCERCIDACIETHDLDPVKAEVDRMRSRDGLSSNRLLSVLKVYEGHFARKACMHCMEPACVSACLVGGLSKDSTGAVMYDAEMCIGCRYCMLACPFHIPRYEWDTTIPFVKKCDMCVDRQHEGLPPACVEACPNQALQFGERDEIIKLARDRIGQRADLYLPRIWGEEELGGTCVLYISDVKLDTLGFPNEVDKAIPSLTEPLISKTPYIGLSVAGSLIGLNWIIRRRMKLGDGKAESAETSQVEDDGGSENG